MERKFLEDLGIDKEIVDKVIAEHGKTVQSLNTKVSTLETENTGLKDDINTRDKDLKDLKAQKGNSEELKAKYDEMEAKYKSEAKDLNAKVSDTQMTAAIKVAVAGKAHDPDMVVSQIDKSKIVLDDNGNIKAGLDDQVKDLETNKAFLFKGDKNPGGAGPAGGDDKDPDPDGTSDADLNAAFGIEAK